MTGRCVIVVVLWSCVGGGAVADEPQPQFGPPPRLATTPREWAEHERSAAYAARRAAALKAGEALIANPPPLPEGYGSWTFYYACADDGADLRALSLQEHECPKCKKRYHDDRTVAAYRGQLHHRLDQAALRLGWAYAYGRDDRFAAGVRRILLHLADAYAAYPGRLDRWGRTGFFAPLGGRRYVQSLDEAVGVIDLAKAYDLTRASPVWQAEDAKHVEDDFFRATAQTLLVFNQDVNNHQTWYDAGLMAIASVLADAKLVQQVLTMRGGFYDQLQRSFGSDGLWYEGSMAYQNYALQALVETVDAGRRMGLPLHESPRFRSLLESSLRVTYPDGTYPAINDSDPTSFRSFAWSYDWAWHVYGEPRFAQAAAWGNPQRLAELLGPEVRVESPFETQSLDLPDAGLVILRSGSGAEQVCAFFDYGPHGGGHGHYDKLSLTLYAGGREWLIDSGRLGYNHREYQTWAKHTVAHNTVVINQADQFPAIGKLLWFQTDRDAAACSAECRGAYLGVTLRRSLHLTPRWLVDVYDVRAERPSQIDWTVHAKADSIAWPAATVTTPAPQLGRGPGYEHLTAGTRLAESSADHCDFIAGPARLRMWSADSPDSQTFAAVGIGQRVVQKSPVVLRRVDDEREARFVTVYDLTGRDYVTKIEAAGDADAAEIVLHTGDGPRRVRFTDRGAEVR